MDKICDSNLAKSSENVENALGEITIQEQYIRIDTPINDSSKNVIEIPDIIENKEKSVQKNSKIFAVLSLVLTMVIITTILVIYGVLYSQFVDDRLVIFIKNLFENLF